MSKNIREAELQSFGKWLRLIGRSRATGWRWRQYGWIETVNIGGQLFVKRAAVERFYARAARGDFAKEPKSPPRSAR